VNATKTDAEVEHGRAPRAQRVAEAGALRDEGTAQVENGADPRVILTIDAHIQKAIDSGKRFSANDIRDEFPVSDEHLVGARFLSFAGRRVDGHPLMKRVGFEPSSLGSTHKHPIAVWLGWDAYQAERAQSAPVTPPARRPATGSAVHPDEQDMLAMLEESPC
jgi:hypothetical protein